jgi:hypothetical protein
MSRRRGRAPERVARGSFETRRRRGPAPEREVSYRRRPDTRAVVDLMAPRLARLLLAAGTSSTAHEVCGVEPAGSSRLGKESAGIGVLGCRAGGEPICRSRPEGRVLGPELDLGPGRAALLPVGRQSRPTDERVPRAR